MTMAHGKYMFRTKLND